MLEYFKAGNGVYLPQLQIGLDYSGLNTRHVFVSHAHSDHIPRPSDADFYATRPTGKFMKLRGFKSTVQELDFFKVLETDSARITFYPAGHILGSAMTFIESDYGNLLYTGDYKTLPSLATEGFKLPEKDIDTFITEATFSLPLYKWKSTEELKDQIGKFALNSLSDGYNPVFLAYNLGKAQELMHLLKDLKIPVQIQSAGFALSSVYAEEGVDLGEYSELNGLNEGKIIICPSSALRSGSLNKLEKRRVAYCSGWAAVKHSRFTVQADSFIPISDHLDFFELLDVCRKLRPKEVVLTHTPNPAVIQHYLEKEGIQTSTLDKNTWA